jgi:hypothetical protein
MRFNRYLIGLSVLTGSWCFAGTPVAPKAAAASAGKYGELPLVFERNQGQADSAVRFLARGRNYVIGLNDEGAELRLKGSVNRTVKLQLEGRRRNFRYYADERLPGTSNYLIGADPRLWIQGVPQYGKVWQQDAWTGIDVAWYGNHGQLEYDFVVQPGVNPDNIRIHAAGAENLWLDSNGDLLLSAGGAELRQKQPVAWQERDGIRTPVRAGYRFVSPDSFAIEVAHYDRTQRLIIDPVLAMPSSTYLGGSLADQGNGIAVDNLGNTWLAGAATSVDFPVTGSPKPVNAGGADAFVAKLDPTGTGLLFATYIGGSGNDQANAIAVDPAGNAYITGSTSSSNFPTKSPLQTANAGGLDAFVVKLSGSGSVVYSTYIGGSGDDSGTGIAVDANGVAYLAGYTASTNFPTASPQQLSNHGGKDSFILKLNSAGSALSYSTYLGGSGDDQANGIAIDSFGAAYVAGVTQSSDFPLTAALQSTYGGHGNAFVVKLTSGGLAVYSTYLGGTGGDAATGIAVDSNGSAYITGFTGSRDFPVMNAFQSVEADASITPSGPLVTDAFLTKLNPAGGAMVFSTYFGGASTGTFSAINQHPGGADAALGIAVDSNGNAYITGSTTTPGATSPGSFPQFFPLQDPLFGYTGPTPPVMGSGLSPYYHSDAFLASFSPTGALLYSTEIGGGLDDAGAAVAVDQNGAAYITGYSKSTNFPLQTPFQGTNGGTSNAFVSRFTFTTPGVRLLFSAAAPSNPDLNVTLNATAPIMVSGSNCGAGSYTATSVLNGLGTSVIAAPGATCAVTVLATPGVAGSRNVFSSWADGPTANPRTITVGAHGAAYTVNQIPQFLLTTSVSPAGAGTIMAAPSSPDGFYTVGSTVTLTAVPNAGFAFNNFVGDLIGITNGQSISMTAPRNVMATFVPSAAPSVSIDTPLTGTSISGMVTVSGWAIDNTTAVGTAISGVQVKIDGVAVGAATYGTARADVCSVFPGRPGCPNVGYTFTFNANTLLPGVNHTITVSATDTDGMPDVGTASVTVTSSLLMPGTKVGVFRGGASFLEDSNGNGVYDPGVDRFIASFTGPGGAQPGDIPVVGDWTGDGHAKVGIYRSSTGQWFLDANNDGVLNAGDFTYSFGGLTGDTPFVGDWNAVAGVSTHKDCIGLFRSGFLWVLDMNCNGSFDDVGGGDAVFPFGGVGGDVPVVGKWTGGTTRVGVVRKYAPAGVPQGNPFFWVLDAGNANAGSSAAAHQPATGSFAFGGIAGDVYVSGDWSGGGIWTAGVYRSGLWVLDSALPGAPLASHTPGLTFGYGGVSTDIPVTGKW